MSDIPRTPRDEPDPSTATLLAIVRGRSLHPVLFVTVLGALSALGPFTMDLYLPAFPLLAHDLQTSDAMVQLTLTATAMGIGVGQLLVGPMSDAAGRRWPLLASTALHVICSLAVAFAPTIEVMAVARFGQGIGAAAGAVVAAAMVRDVFGGKRLVRIAARIALVNGLAPLIAPVIGSQLLRVTSWRGVFVLLAAFGLVTLVAAAVVLPETLPAHRRRSTSAPILVRVRVPLRDRVYLGVVIVATMVFGAIVSFLSASPFLFQDTMGLTAQQFGLVFVVNAVGLFIATQLAARLMRSSQPAVLLGVSLPVIVIVGLGFVAVGLSGAGLLWAMIPSFLMVSLHGFSNPCVHVLMLAEHQNESGTAVAVSGFFGSVVGGGMSLLPALLGGVSWASLGLVVAGAGVLAVVALLFIVRPGSVRPLAHA